MAVCCGAGTAHGEPCPRCAQVGPVVGAAPVRAHRTDAADGPWQYCPTEGCDVVFHLDGSTVTDRGLRTRVGNKAVDAPEPVCFCFGHTRTDLADDLTRHDGASTIKTAIAVAVAGASCACEHLNPQGSCCLAAVHRTLTAIRSGTVPIR
jgi:hypothetical protein